jgi:hypothetical protein
MLKREVCIISRANITTCKKKLVTASNIFLSQYTFLIKKTQKKDPMSDANQIRETKISYFFNGHDPYG